MNKWFHSLGCYRSRVEPNIDSVTIYSPAPVKLNLLGIYYILVADSTTRSLFISLTKKSRSTWSGAGVDAE